MTEKERGKQIADIVLALIEATAKIRMVGHLEGAEWRVVRECLEEVMDAWHGVPSTVDAFYELNIVVEQAFNAVGEVKIYDNHQLVERIELKDCFTFANGLLDNVREGAYVANIED